jgi:adenine-specific DNA-methyltransferase
MDAATESPLYKVQILGLRSCMITMDTNPRKMAGQFPEMLGFIYAPSDTVYRQHGYSTERDFIYVTTQTLRHDQLQQLSDEVGEHRSLLVMCAAFRDKPERYSNLTIKKIPQAVLARCEWGHDDCSPQVENLPKAPLQPEQGTLEFVQEGGH